MAAFTFDFSVVGQDDDASIESGGIQCFVDIPQTHYILKQNASHLHPVASVVAPNMMSVPLAQIALALSNGLYIADGSDGVAFDSVIHPQTLAYNADAAEAADFGSGGEHAGVQFPTIFAFAHAYAAGARAGKSSAHEAPWRLYGEDIIHIPNDDLAPQYAAWNHITITDLSVDGLVAPWLRLHWLLFPLTPAADMDDDDNDTPTMMRFIDAAAKAAFPARHAASPRTAIAALLTSPETYELPYQLATFGMQLAVRMQYIDLCVNWVTRDRALVVKELFSTVLAHTEKLRDWLNGAAAPYSGALRMREVVDGVAGALDVPAIIKLDTALASGIYDHLWSDERTSDANIDYFVADLKGRSAGAVAAGSAVGAALHAPPSQADAVLHNLFNSVSDALAGGSGEFGAIDKIYSSGSGAAIRWLNGKHVKGARDQFPQGFVAKSAALPGMQHEYLLDAIKHRDTGELDKDLEGLDLAAFAQGTTPVAKARFFTLVLAGNYTAIDWDKDYVHKIARFLDPKAKVLTVAQAMRDGERRKMYMMYIGRLLDAVGKPPASDESFAAYLAHIEDPISRATRAGDAMLKDCIEHVVKLYDAVWLSAENRVTACLTYGGEWQASLYDANMSARETFDTFAAEISEAAKYARRFTNSVKSAAEQASPEYKQRDKKGKGDGKGGDKGAGKGKGDAPANNGSWARGNVRQPGDMTHQIRIFDLAHPVGWFKHKATSRDWYHKREIENLAREKLGLENQCVEVGMTKSDRQHMVGYCWHNHRPGCPEHQLYERYDEIKPFFQDGVHYFYDNTDDATALGVENDRPAPANLGRGAGQGAPGKGGGKGKGQGGDGKGKDGKGGGKGKGRGKGGF